jgi:hypothetical protein
LALQWKLIVWLLVVSIAKVGREVTQYQRPIALIAEGGQKKPPYHCQMAQKDVASGRPGTMTTLTQEIRNHETWTGKFYPLELLKLLGTMTQHKQKDDSLIHRMFLSQLTVRGHPYLYSVGYYTLSEGLVPSMRILSLL